MNEEYLLKQSFKNTLHEANASLKAKSISFPAISAGIFKFPIEKCAKIFFASVIEYISQNKEGLTLEEIRVVLFD